MDIIESRMNACIDLTHSSVIDADAMYTATDLPTFDALSVAVASLVDLAAIAEDTSSLSPDERACILSAIRVLSPTPDAPVSAL